MIGERRDECAGPAVPEADLAFMSPEAMDAVRGETAMAFQILSLCPRISAIFLPSLTDHSRSVVSLLPVTARAPSGVKPTA